jgi:hypothetical protein
LAFVQSMLGAGAGTSGGLSLGVFEVAGEHGSRADFAAAVDDAGGAQLRAGMFDGVAGEPQACFDATPGRARQATGPGTLNRGRRHPGAGRDLHDRQVGEPDYLYHEIPERVFAGPAVAVAALGSGLAGAGGCGACAAVGAVGAAASCRVTAAGAGAGTFGGLSFGVFEVAGEDGWRAGFAGVADDAGGAELRAGVFDGVAGELLAGFDGAAGRAGQATGLGALDHGRRHPGAGRGLGDGQLGEPDDFFHEIPERVFPGPAVAVAALGFGLADTGELFFEGVHLVRADLRAVTKAFHVGSAAEPNSPGGGDPPGSDGGCSNIFRG